MLLPLAWSLFYGEGDWPVFLISGFFTCLIGYLAYRSAGLKGDFRNREALAVVTLSWVLASVFGAIPYLLTGTLPSIADAIFETMSGFTTTGASVITNIEVLSHGILFWRSLTHWLGGMGIVVLLVAILSTIGMGSMQMFRAESPGPTTEKIKPRISEMAKILWYTYLILTILQISALWFMGMNLFDAMCHTFGTLATGGFSTKNASVGHYQSSGIHWVITIFMFLSGANFALYYQALRGKSLMAFWRSAEFKLYTFFVLAASFIVVLNLMLRMGYTNIFIAIRDSFFQVTSIITTTGFATVDFDRWPFLAQSILVVLMFIGGCTGSTGGSVKVGRILVMLQQIIVELRRAIHPKAILNLKVNGKIIPNELVINILQFFFIYMLLVGGATVYMTAVGLDLVSAFTSVAATLGNVGPGLGRVGPTANYSFIPDSGKYFLTILMMLGRLELYTVLVILTPSFWRD